MRNSFSLGSLAGGIGSGTSTEPTVQRTKPPSPRPALAIPIFSYERTEQKKCPYDGEDCFSLAGERLGECKGCWDSDQVSIVTAIAILEDLDIRRPPGRERIAIQALRKLEAPVKLGDAQEGAR